MPQNSTQTHIANMRRKYQEKPLIAPRDVLYILGISTTTLNRMVKDEVLTALRLGSNNNKNSSRRFELESVLSSFKK